MATVVPLVRAQLGGSALGSRQPTSAIAAEQSVKANLSAYIKQCYESSRMHRQNEGVDQRMIDALRSVRGEYDPQTLASIRQFGGSEVYARITASKVRGVAALLREIYTAAERPWALSPTPEPELAGPSLMQVVMDVMRAEMMEMAAQGITPPQDMLQKRMTEVREMVLQARKKAAKEGLRAREDVIDDILWEGGYYNALWEFLLDLATFPFACIKGPVVRYKRRVKWNGNKPTVQNVPTMEWHRCSPFDIYFAPWSQNPQDGYIIHRQRTNRASLQALRNLPSYDNDAIDRVLAASPSSMSQWVDWIEHERAGLEQRESEVSPIYSSHAVDKPMPMLEFNGPVSGTLLLQWGMKPDQVPDASQDLEITAYLVGDEVIGVRANPHPLGRKPFYVDSFERVPGSCYGHAVPDLINDIQGVANATIRSLVNNLAIASGPMAWINDDRISDNDPDPTKMWPWKVFRTTDSLNSNSNEKPMEFFQPQTNANELMMVYEKFAQMADELSSLPRYMQGNAQGLGGAGRTASGLSMLIEASNRTIKQTVSSVDSNVIEPTVEDLNIYLAILRPEVVMEGDITVVARGAVELVQRETLRMRQLEFLNITNNPVDHQLVGPQGRYNLLKEVARDLGMPVSDMLPVDPSKAMPAPQMPGSAPAQGQAPAAAPQEQPTAPTDGMARGQAMSPGQ